MHKIEYNHGKNAHSLEGAVSALQLILENEQPESLLDVGCGPGMWVAAARLLGIKELLGVDGVNLPSNEMQFDKELFMEANLEKPWNVGRQFDVALCLEVAEHLSPAAASTLVDTITRHSNRIYFSAAAPHQEGQHHVNCQWPAYWQGLFNEAGYRCEDTIRNRIWTDERIEWWYRQNIFVAIRDERGAGEEPRLLPLIHPSSLKGLPHPTTSAFRNEIIDQVENGSETVAWYLSLPFRGVLAKVRRF